MPSRTDARIDTQQETRQATRQDIRAAAGRAHGAAAPRAVASGHPQDPRAVARWLTVATGCLALLAWHGADLLRRIVEARTPAGLVGLDGDPSLVIEAAVVTVGIAVSLRIVVAALLAVGCTGLRRTGRAWARGERWARRLAPRLMRGALVAAIGSGIALAGSPAWAVHDPAPAPLNLPTAVTMQLAATAWSSHLRTETPGTDLGWGSPAPAQVPTEVVEPPGVEPTAPSAEPATAVPGIPVIEATVAAPAPATQAPVAAPAPAAAAPAPATEATLTPTIPATSVTVVTGDSLWAIAAAHLPEGSSNQSIAEAWPRWYEQNRAVIGADPNHIVPGQVLVIPEGLR